MSHVRRLRTSDRIFFVTINLRRALAPLSPAEYAHVAEAMSESRQKLGFLFLGYVLMPDHWHALIWPAFPLTIFRVVQHVKWLSARSDGLTGASVNKSVLQHALLPIVMSFLKEPDEKVKIISAPREQVPAAKFLPGEFNRPRQRRFKAPRPRPL